MKCKPHPGFELWTPFSFPMTIKMTPSAPSPVFDIYIYIYIEREREKERCLFMYVHVYIYIYIYIYICIRGLWFLLARLGSCCTIVNQCPISMREHLHTFIYIYI